MVTLMTYLQYALKENRVFRWPDKLMPLKIYIAPFRWYQTAKQQEASLYHLYVAEALKIWHEATLGKFTFIITNDYNNSNINILWRRVNRKSLGLCHINGTKDYLMYSAEVEIGISDGIIHAQYQDTSEVKHTIIHEMGHAIGLAHSPYEDDIMFVPHRYGVVSPSYRDLNTAKWLYMLEPGFDATPYKEDWGLEPSASIDELIWVYEHEDEIVSGKYSAKEDQSSSSQLQASPETKIMTQQDILAYQNLYNMSLQHIKVDLTQKKPINKQSENSSPKTKNKLSSSQKSSGAGNNIFKNSPGPFKT